MDRTISDSKKRWFSDNVLPHQPPPRQYPRRMAESRTALLGCGVNTFLCLVMGIFWARLDTVSAGGTESSPTQAAHPDEHPSSADEVDPSETPEVIVPEPRFVAPTGRDRIGRIWAPVLINGKGPYRLVLNTGSNSSAVIARVAESLGLPLGQPVRLHGATGTAVVPTAAVDRLEFGALRVEPGKLPIVADVFGGAEGVLGSEGFADKRIFIDFENDAIGISRSRRERAASGFIRIPLQFEDGQTLTVKAMVGRIQARAIIDTGAQQTIGNVALREALLRRPGGGQKKDNIVGVTLDVAEGDRIRVPPVEIGQLRILGLYVTFGEMAVFEQLNMRQEPAMLIGMDALGTLDTLIIDYKLPELQVRTRRSGVDHDRRLEVASNRRMAVGISRAAIVP